MARLQKPHTELYVYYTAVSSTLSAPELPACIVGPCYQVERGVLAGAWDLSQTTYTYPSQEAGTAVDTSSVTVTLSDSDNNEYSLPYELLASKSGGALSQQGSNWKLVFTHTASDLDIRSGDQVTFSSPVIPSISPETMTVDTSSMSDVGGGSYQYTLVSTETTTDINSYDDVIFDIDICVPTISTASVIVPARVGGILPEGNIYLTYRAFYANKNVYREITSEDDITDYIGGRDVLNPLGYAVGVALDNAVTSVYAFGVSTDDATGHSEARDELELHEPYAIVPLTTGETIKQAYKTHAVNMSLPANKKERIICLGAQGIDWYTDVLVSQTGNIVDNGDGTATVTCTDSSPQVGQYVNVSAPARVVGRYLITSKDGTNLVITQDIGATVSSVNYKVERSTTKTEKRDAAAAYATAFGTKRVVCVFPPVLSDGTNSLTSMYGAAAIAGTVSGISPQVPLSNTSISGFTGRTYSNDYFTETNLDYIAGGGNLILVQETDGAALIIRHQLTTDVTSLDTRELSRVKNTDFVAKFLRSVVKNYLGKYNVTDELLNVLKLAFDGAFTYLRRQRAPRAGGIIRFGRLTSISAASDTVTAVIEVGIGYPFNVAVINLYVS